MCYTKRAHGPPLTPVVSTCLHDLRHTNASLALDAGIDIKVVSHRLGHATTAITQDLYTPVSAKTDEAAAERIADLLRRPSEADASTRQAREEP